MRNVIKLALLLVTNRVRHRHRVFLLLRVWPSPCNAPTEQWLHSVQLPYNIRTAVVFPLICTIRNYNHCRECYASPTLPLEHFSDGIRRCDSESLHMRLCLSGLSVHEQSAYAQMFMLRMQEFFESGENHQFLSLSYLSFIIYIYIYLSVYYFRCSPLLFQCCSG